MTPEEYEAQARKESAEHEALANELRKAIANAEARASEFIEADPDKPETAEKVRAHVVELVPEAKLALQHLLLHADSEAVRAGVAKFVMAAGMKALEGDKDKEDWAELLNKIGKDKSKTS